MARILVTGGGGFIGSHLVRSLLKEGHSVRLLDNFSTGRRENVEDLLSDVELIDPPEGIASPEVCESAVQGVDGILHQGAIPSVPRSVADPVLSDRVNVGGTVALLEAARKAGVGRFVYASSSSVYGDAPGDIRVEDDTTKPLSPYAVSKLAAEHYAIMYYKLHGLETVGLRYFNVFGPRQDPNSQYAAVVPIFTQKLLAGDSPTIFGDGEQSRDFTYIDNVVSGNMLALKAEGIGGEVFNLAAGDNHSVNQLFFKIRDLTGQENIEPIYAPPQPGDVRRSQANIAKAERMLNFRVLVSFDEGLQRTVEWYRQAEKEVHP